MNNQQLLFLCTLLFLLARPTLECQAQQTTPNSRLTIGMEIGRGMLNDCEICDPSNIVNTPLQSTDPESYQVIGADVSYRINRWVSMVARISHGKLQTQSTKVLVNHSSEQGYPIQQSVVANARMLGVGPQFMLRLNQGDLGLEIRTGLNVHNARVRATGLADAQIDLRYKLRVSRYTASRLYYTYWPTEWFGIQAAVELFGGDLYAVAPYEPKTPYAEAYPQLPQEDLQRLTPNSGVVNSYNFSLGIHYRLKGQ